VTEYQGWDSITPEEFYRRHVAVDEPAIFRGAATGPSGRPGALRALSPCLADWIARTTWTDAYLRRTFGELTILTEDKSDNRDIPPEGMKLADFLDVYRSDGKDALDTSWTPVDDGLPHPWGVIRHALAKENLDVEAPSSRVRVSPPSRVPFLVTQTPDAMLNETSVFPLLRCGVYVNGTGKPLLVESNLWLSSGETASTLHEDADPNVNCLLQGIKHWFLIAPEIRHTVGMTDRGLSSAFSSSDVNDASTLPDPENARFRSFVAKAGDCVYLPGKYPHQVRSYPGRNLAVTLLFEAPPEWPTGQHDCSESTFGGSRQRLFQALRDRHWSIADVGLRWGFSGNSSSDISMGLEDPEMILSELMNMVRQTGSSSLTPSMLSVALAQHVFNHLDESGASGVNPPKLWNEAKRVFSAFAVAAQESTGAPDSEAIHWVTSGIPLTAIDAAKSGKTHAHERAVRTIEKCLTSRCVDGVNMAEVDVDEDEEEEDDDDDDDDELNIAELDALGELLPSVDQTLAQLTSVPLVLFQALHELEAEQVLHPQGLLFEDASSNPPSPLSPGTVARLSAWQGVSEEENAQAALAERGEEDEEEEEDQEDEELRQMEQEMGKTAPPGHGRPLGEHLQPEGEIASVEWDGRSGISPFALWDNFTRDRIPVVLRSAITDWPAMELWKNDTWLRERYGYLEVRLEEKKERGEGAGAVSGLVGYARDTIDNFLRRYQLPGENGYVVSQLPDPMRRDVNVPRFLNCPLVQSRMMEFNLWISSGDTRSIIHRDPHNFVNCLLFGEKRWIFIEPKYQHLVPMEAEAQYEAGGACRINPLFVDLEHYASFANVPYRVVVQYPGDCIVSPGAYLHQVYSPPGRNVAVAFLYGRLQAEGDEDAIRELMSRPECVEHSWQEPAPLWPHGPSLPPQASLSTTDDFAALASSVSTSPDPRVVNPFSGFGALSLGNTDPLGLGFSMTRVAQVDCSSNSRAMDPHAVHQARERWASAPYRARIAVEEEVDPVVPLEDGECVARRVTQLFGGMFAPQPALIWGAIAMGIREAGVAPKGGGEDLSILLQHVFNWQRNITAGQLAAAAGSNARQIALRAWPRAGLGPAPLEDSLAERVMIAARELSQQVQFVSDMALAIASIPRVILRSLSSSFNVDPSNTLEYEWAAIPATEVDHCFRSIRESLRHTHPPCQLTRDDFARNYSAMTGGTLHFGHKIASMIGHHDPAILSCSELDAGLPGVLAVFERWDAQREFDHSRESRLAKQYLQGLPGVGPGDDATDQIG
jgi:hypothetical protein